MSGSKNRCRQEKPLHRPRPGMRGSAARMLRIHAPPDRAH